MRDVSGEGLELCRLQGRIFERSLEAVSCSSAVFVRQFMNSDYATRMDEGAVLWEATTLDAVFDELKKEYGETTYGTERYGADELYWMGYLYRYWACSTGERSARIYKTVGAREMRALFEPYHTLDPAQAIQRIAEAKGIGLDGWSLERAVEALRRIRSQ